MNKKGRMVYLDVMKGITALCMVLGHSIQYSNGLLYKSTMVYHTNWLFKLIYTWHMPMFMLIAGYCFYFTYNRCEKNIFAFISNRVRTILVPILSWSSINFMLFYQCDLTQIRACAFGTLWFLWVFLYASTFVYVIEKWLKGSVYIYAACVPILFFIPDSYNLSLFKFMYPFFVVGYMVKKNNFLTGFSIKKYCGIVLMALFVWLMICRVFDQDMYIYETGCSFISYGFSMELILINVLRWTAGFSGSSVVLFAVYLCMEKRKTHEEILSRIGKDSFGIYALNLYFDQIVLLLFADWEYNLCRTIIVSVVVTIISLLVLYVMKRVKYINILFLGGR